MRQSNEIRPRRIVAVLIVSLILSCDILAEQLHAGDPATVVPPISAAVDHFGDALPRDAIRRLGTLRLRHSQPVGVVAYSPDGKFLATAGNGQIKLWSNPEGKLAPQVFPDVGMQILCLSFSADGTRLAVGGSEALIILKASTGEELLRLLHRDPNKVAPRNVVRRGDLTAIDSAAFSPDGKLVASIGRNAAVNLWDCETGRSVFKHQFDSPASIDTSAVAFSPDGRQLAASRGAKVVLFDWGERNERMLAHPDDYQAVSLAYSADGKLLSSTGYSTSTTEAEMRLWNPTDGSLIHTLKHASKKPLYFGASALSRDGSKLITAHFEKLLLWDTRAGKVVREIDYPRTQGFRTNGVALSPDGSFLAAVGNDHGVRVWKTADRVPVLELAEGHSDFIRDLNWSADGQRILSASLDGTLRSWNVDTGRETQILYRSKAPLTRMQVSPDESTVVVVEDMGPQPTGGEQGLARFFSLPNGTLQGEAFCGFPIMAMAFSPNSRQLAVASGLGRPVSARSPTEPAVISLWDVATRQRITWSNEVSQTVWLKGHTRAVNALRFSPDGHILASAAGDGSLRHWDIQQGRLMQAKFLRAPRRKAVDPRVPVNPRNLPLLQAVAFTPELDQTAIVTDEFHHVSIRKLFGEREERQADLGSSEMNDTAISLSRDGRTGAVTGRDLTTMKDLCILFDMASGRVLHEFLGEDEGFLLTQFSPDGGRLACATRLGTILIFQIPDAVVQRK